MEEARRPSQPQARRVVAIVQSCYIPWKGYFDLIGKVDHFVLYDDVQFVKRHWHNRNKIKTANGPTWLTIPVQSKGRYLQNIDETLISEKWAEKHWRSIAHAYAKAPHFAAYRDRFEAAYQAVDAMERLSDVNFHFLKMIADMLDIRTGLSWSSDYSAEGRKADRLLNVCKALNAGRYLSGPSAKAYFENEKFDDADVEVEWMDYSGYPEYPQLHGPFDHAVSIIDLLMNVGADARSYMKAPIRPS